jgi:cytochrome c-type biogenesis protein CcmF
MVARVLSVMGIISVGFLLFMLLTSNPFDRLFPAAPDGRDLNPLLQDPAMVIHPPMLYMGYVGFSVAFAFAISALISGRLDATWARWSRPGLQSPGCFSPAVSHSEAGGLTTNSVGAAGGFGPG